MENSQRTSCKCWKHDDLWSRICCLFPFKSTSTIQFKKSRTDHKACSSAQPTFILCLRSCYISTSLLCNLKIFRFLSQALTCSHLWCSSSVVHVQLRGRLLWPSELIFSQLSCSGVTQAVRLYWHARLVRAASASPKCVLSKSATDLDVVSEEANSKVKPHHVFVIHCTHNSIQDRVVWNLRLTYCK